MNTLKIYFLSFKTSLKKFQIWFFRVFPTLRIPRINVSLSASIPYTYYKLIYCTYIHTVCSAAFVFEYSYVYLYTNACSILLYICRGGTRLKRSECERMRNAFNGILWEISRVAPTKWCISLIKQPKHLFDTAHKHKFMFAQIVARRQRRRRFSIYIRPLVFIYIFSLLFIQNLIIQCFFVRSYQSVSIAFVRARPSKI